MDDKTGGTKNTAQEMPGPAGIDTAGGERTPPQDAGALLKDVNRQRGKGQRMEERQLAGDVELQNHHHHPSAANPEEGLPAAIPGNEEKYDA